ncbi:TPM domain-containing protein [Leptolyngbya sp. CCNP1308]|uniref:TPM domain-containing protein n=1 Tax=Leptolyngbya sp. CCNP1308 TaxID=3110255 RepID=UPI002B20BC4F|nr:TPM domain-containing protein [Leptolyngbya sp. CCNP1308]MEA5451721.1 TPM domain-containing protein [Leptolyngbya sp. CCNP1308]
MKFATVCYRWTVGLGRYRYGLLGVVSAIALLLSSLSGGVQAQGGYPAFQDPYVNDYADVLSDPETSQVRGQLELFRNQTGIHAVLLTINSIQDYPTGNTALEPFATQLFNTWGIGDAARNDGILLLVAPGDRKVRIELGSGYDSRYDRVAQAIIDDTILPKFRQGDIAQGTALGISEIVDNFDPDRPPSNNPILFYISRLPGGLWLGSGLAAIGGAGLAGAIALQQWLRYRQRNCPKCQSAMERLDEQADDRHLSPGQRVEESIKSVDYDVWFCHSCGHHTVSDYSSFGSGYQTCPGCRHKTMAVTTHTLVAPTYDHSGQAEVSEACRFCDRTNRYTRTLPRKERPSSSGGSGGGGGRSSGGGASGSW